MSTLTKLFVVLLVVVSMLQSAATIVFVQKLGPLQPALDKANNEVSLANQRSFAAAAAAQTSENKYEQEVAIHAQDRQNDSALAAALQQQLDQANTKISSLQSDNARIQANMTSLTSSQTLSAASIGKLQDQATSLRSENELLLKRSEEDSRAIAELKQLDDTLQSKLNDTTEQLAIQKDSGQKLAAWVQSHGGDATQVEDQPTAVVTQAINGTVKDKSVINGNTWVTISVGSADGVEKGTKFNVLDHGSGQWLGIVTIQTVDTNDASGTLEGPGITSVTNGSDVKTQLTPQ